MGGREEFCAAGFVIVLLAAGFAAFIVLPGRASGLTERPPISIVGDVELAAANGVIGGDGSPSNPFVIAGWRIDVRDYLTTGIRITDTTRSLVIRDLEVYTSAPYGQFGGGGIALSSVRNVRVANVTISGVQRGISAMGSNLTIESNDVSSLSGSIWAGYGADITIRNNTVTPASPYYSVEGIGMGRAVRGLISGNWVSGEGGAIGGYGIGIGVTDNVTVRDNLVELSDYGITIGDSSNATVTGNVLRKTSVVVMGFNRTSFDSHTIPADNLVDGVPFRYYSGCTNLTIDGVPAGGMLIASCSRVEVTGLDTNGSLVMAFVDNATVVSNTFRGIRAGMGHRYSTNISVFHNDFLQTAGKPSQSYNAGSRWDDGYPSGGNYYSDYTIQDRCSGPGQDVCPDPDGIGDGPVPIRENGVDRYPLMAPHNAPPTPPVASFEHDSPVVTGAWVHFRSTSSDADGAVLYYYWDYGDGGTSTYPTLGYGTHIFDRPGTFLVTHTVTDNSGLSDTVTESIVVHLPAAASISFSPLVPSVAEIIVFDGSGSHSPYDRIVTYAWDFGDGAQGQGASASHAYSTPGRYTVTLQASDDIGQVLIASATVLVLEFVSFDHPAGFRLPVPASWDRTVDQVTEGANIELVLTGPAPDNGRTAILVDTDSDPTLREDEESLRNFADQLIDAILSEMPGATVRDAPETRTLASHRAISFSLNYTPQGLAQKIVLVVSEEHGRFWLILLTTGLGVYGPMESLLERMVLGFEITAWTTRQVVLAAGGVLVSVALVLFFAILVVLRSRRRPRPLQAAMDLATPRSCDSCGGVNGPSARFCTSCGSRMPDPTPTRPTDRSL